MEKKITLLAFVSILLLSLIVANASWTELGEQDEEEIVYVDRRNKGDPRQDGSYKHPFDTIVKGVRRAGVFAREMFVTVKVANETYPETEPIKIDRRLKLIGDGMNNTIIQPDDQFQPIENVIKIDGYLALHGCNISGFTIDLAPETPHIGIRIVDVKDPTNIYENKIKSNDYAIKIENDTVRSCENICITGNIVYNNNPNGIWMEGCSNCVVANNIIDGKYPKGPGIHVSNVRDSTILGNILMNNVNGVSMSEVQNVTVVRNTLMNNVDGVSLSRVQNVTILDNDINESTTAIKGSYSDFNNITGNTIRNIDGNGIDFEKCVNNTFENNTVSGCITDGISFLECQNHGIINNFFCNCSSRAVRLDNSNFTTITGNTIFMCTYGIKTMNNTKRNAIFHNNFFDNGLPAEGGGDNSWDAGDKTGGNYWSDYEGEDKDGNRLGDKPYLGLDRYPLIVPTRSIPFICKGTMQYCTIVSNSTISRFKFDEQTMIITFDVTGRGFCSFTVSRRLLDGAFNVSVNDTPTPCITTWDDNVTSIYFECRTSVSNSVKVRAQVTEPVTEPPPVTWDQIRKQPEILEQIKNFPDIDGDGKIGLGDIFVVARHWGVKREDP